MKIKLSFWIVIVTGLIAGTLDALAATIHFLLLGGKNPLKVFNYIASGVFGRSAFSGGLLMSLAGLLFHLTIATIWALLFFVVYARIKVLRRSWLLSGIGYGAIVWLGMNLVVVPLSNTPPLQNKPDPITGILILIFCIGIPISISARRYFKKQSESES